MPLILLTLLAAQPIWLDTEARSHAGRVAEGPRGTRALIVPGSGPAVLRVFEASGRFIGEPRVVLQSGLFAQLVYAPELESWGVVGVREGNRVGGLREGRWWARRKAHEAEGVRGAQLRGLCWRRRRAGGVEFRRPRVARRLRLHRFRTRAPWSPGVASGEMTPVQFGAAIRPARPSWTKRGWVVGAQAPTHYELYTLIGDEVSTRVVPTDRVNESAITFDGEACIIAAIELLPDATQLRLIRVPPTGDVTSRIVASGGGLQPATKAPPILTQVWIERRPGKQTGFTVILGEQHKPGEWPGLISGLRLDRDFEPTEPKRPLTSFGVTVGWVDVAAIGSELLIAAEAGDLNLPHRRVLFTTPR
jgi:hypothetical protein